MDFDIEMEDAAAQYQNEVHEEPLLQEDFLGVQDVQEPGEIDEARDDADIASTVLVPTKVYIRGLDALTPDDIKAYVAEHIGGGDGDDIDGDSSIPFKRIEWIDDTSANLVFPSETAAATALSALSTIQIDDVSLLPLGEPLPAKTYSAKPDEVSAGLYVRLSLASDKKQVGAAARSRFYLFHPEFDPEERRRNQLARGRRRDDRDRGRDRGDRDRDYRSSRSYRSYRDERQDDRENDIRNNSFDVSLYDDDVPALSRRGRRRSLSRSRSRSRSWSRPRRSNREKELFPASSARAKELFPDKLGGEPEGETGTARRSDRDRVRDRDYDEGKGRDNDSGRLRNRSASPLRGGYVYFDDASDYDGRLADERAEEVAAEAARNREKARKIRTLLENGQGDDADFRELFPRASDTAQLDLLDNTNAGTAKLSDRITRPLVAAESASTFNIRGIADSNGNGASDGHHGISIKGIASARELFPSKLNNSNGNEGGGRSKRGGRNAGKEVFDNSLASRIQRPRQRAEDLFH